MSSAPHHHSLSRKCSCDGHHTEPPAIPHTCQAPGCSAGCSSGCPTTVEAQAEAGASTQWALLLAQNTFIRALMSEKNWVFCHSNSHSATSGVACCYTGRQSPSLSSDFHPVFFRRLPRLRWMHRQTCTCRHTAGTVCTHLLQVKIMNATERLPLI